MFLYVFAFFFLPTHLLLISGDDRLLGWKRTWHSNCLKFAVKAVEIRRFDFSVCFCCTDSQFILGASVVQACKRSEIKLLKR